MFGYPSSEDNTTVWNETNLFCGNVKLKESDFYTDRYCNNNFNDVLKAMKVLFDLMVVNQWHGILCFLWFLIRLMYKKLVYVIEPLRVQYGINHRLVSPVGKVPVYRVGGLGSIPGRINTQGLKIIEEKVLPLL